MSTIIQSLEYMAGEALLYVIFGTIAALFLTVVAVVPLLVAIPVFGAKRSLALVKRVVLFALAVHLAGFVGSLVFVGLFANRLYFARDQIVDWLPYLPSMNWTLDPMCGGHLAAGVSPAMFYAAWFAVALPVWWLAGLIYRRFARSLRPAAVA
jgi:hypothetical protein